MSIYTLRTGVSNHPEKTVLAHLTDMVRSGGVLSLNDNDFAVAQSNPPGLQVLIQPGRAYLKAASSNAYPVIADSSQTLSLSENSTSNPRLDTIILYADLTHLPDPDQEGKDIVRLLVIPGVPASTPTPATPSEIAAIIGVTAPFLTLANILVAPGATAILDQAITDIRRRAYLKTPRSLVNLSALDTFAPNGLLSDHYQITATANLTLALPENLEPGDWLAFTFVQDSELGNHQLTFDPAYQLMSSDLAPNNLPAKATTYMIERSDTNYRLYLAGRQE